MDLIENPRRVVPNRKGRFTHYFGGNREIVGLPRRKKKPPIHQLYDFDLSDPALAFIGISRKVESRRSSAPK